MEAEKIEKESEALSKQNETDTIEAELNKNRQTAIVKTRSKASDLQEKNSEKMITSNDKLLGKASVGDIVVFFKRF